MPSQIDGKPAVARHFEIQTNSSKAKPTEAVPVEIPKDVKMAPPVTAVKAKSSSGSGEKAVVTYVGDGDGAELKRQDGSKLVCRIDTIDAPEVVHKGVDKKTGKPYDKPTQSYGEESKRTLQALIQNKEVTVTVTRPAKQGKYDRNYCKIEVEGVGVDAKMLEAGAAWLYRRYSSDAYLSKLENEAKAAKRGLWSEKEPENPETFRHRYD